MVAYALLTFMILQERVPLVIPLAWIVLQWEQQDVSPVILVTGTMVVPARLVMFLVILTARQEEILDVQELLFAPRVIGTMH